MNIHSRFLIHWTGRDISTNAPRELKRVEMEGFVERLRNILRNGLRMIEDEEKIYGMRERWIKIKIPRVCFTEVKLSQTQKHAAEYGLLGVGLSRKFIMSRYGNPVFYVQNGGCGAIVENFDVIRGYLSDKESIKSLEVVLGFLKNMSDKNRENLKYYDEMEWRIIHSDLLERKKLIIKSNKDSYYYLRLRSDHIKAIVFPNHKTKKMALEDEWLRQHLFKKHVPMITTVMDCKNF